MTPTLTVMEKKTELVPGFDEARFAALGRPERADSFREYAEALMPTVRTEEWRRTDPSRFAFERRTPLPILPQVAPKPGPWDEHFDAVVSITDEGFGVRDVSGAIAAGAVIFQTLEKAAADFPTIGNFRAVDDRRRAPKFPALVRAFWNVGLYIRIADGVELKRGILVRHEHAADGKIILPRLVVHAGARSRASLSEHLVSADAARFLAISSKDMSVGEGASLSLLTLQEWGAGTDHVADDAASVARDGRLEWTVLNLGGRVAKLNFASDAVGEGASAELGGLYFVSGAQHVDQRTLQIHSAPHTASNLLYKGAAKDAATSVYQGLIVAKPGAVGVDAYQRNNNLVLDDGARADSLPGLEIDTDDLKCSHGSTIGNVDPDEVFYLRSRGLSEAEAREMLVAGFFEETLGRVPHEFVKERVRERVREKLAT